jgi:molybdopterin molybdotransferase
VALMPVADALAKVLAQAIPLPSEQAPLIAAHGRVLAEDLKARRTQPPGNVSAMDGYAVRAADVAVVPVVLKVIGEIAAGHDFPGRVNHGEAARIFTGAIMPPGADSVVVQENVERDGDRITVKSSAPPGKHVRHGGLDFAAGAVLLQKGRRLTGRDLMLAAAMNLPAVPVHGRPKLAMLATGDELVMPGIEPGPSQIVYSNGYAVMALAASEGAEVIDLGIVPDRVEETITAIRRAREARIDILVTSGGASVGDYDLVQQALAAERMSLSFWKIALRPGRPLMHGKLGAMNALGLPGNPVSAYVCALLFMVPLIRKLSGRTDLELPVESARLGSDQRANDERTDCLRATLEMGPDGVPVATAFPVQDSSLMAALARADCLLIREPFAPAARTGEACRIVRLPL